MQPGSRSTNRTKNNFHQTNQTFHHSSDIFNHSFYQQKITNAQTYQSLQYIKRYMKETNIVVIIQKIMNTLLHLQKLPYNPYNLMYRLIHHEAIYQNLRRHYQQESQQNNFVNSNSPQIDEYDLNGSPGSQIQDLFLTMKLKEKDIFLSQRLSKYLNMTNLFVFAKIIYHKKNNERIKTVCEDLSIKDVHISIGGPVLINLRGNRGVLDVPVKLPKQLAQKSLYCGESMLTTTMYIEMGREFSKCFNDFVEFILTDIKASMHYKDQHHTVYFQKLEMINIDQVFSLVEFSREQLINNSTLVKKQLLRNLERDNITIKTKNILRLNRELASVIGEQFITMYKEYVLMAEQKGLTSVVSNQPLKYALKQIFFSDKVIDTITENPQYKDTKILTQYKRQMVYHLLYELKMQNISFLVWQLFYYLIYETNTTSDNQEIVNELFHNISYILLSPIGFVYQLQHALRCVKWLTLPSFPSFSQNEAYNIIINVEREITTFIQKGNYIYWQLQIFYEAIKMLLSIIIQFKQLKVKFLNIQISSINFIVDHASLMLTGVITNFNHILLVLQGNITSYINVMCQQLAQVKKQSQKIITYDLYLKEKQLPTSVLKVSEEVKKIKKQLSMQQSEVKTILLGKYVSRYKLYQKIYSYYWQLIIGKKVMFPLSQFLKILMMNSTQCNYQLFKQNYSKPKHSLQSHIVNSVTIYELSNTEAGATFYSLHSDSLQIPALKQYKTIIELLQPFLDVTSPNQTNLGFRYGSKQSVEMGSLKNIGSMAGKRVILSIKSIDMGDNSAEQSSSFSVCKVLLDIIVPRGFNNKNEFYAYVLQEINSLMNNLDRHNYAVLGLFSYSQNHYQTLSYDDYLYSRLLSEENCLRFDYKKKINLSQFSKFLDFNINQGKFIEIKLIYMVRDVTKVLKVGVNLHYRNGQSHNSLFKPHYVNQRVFSSKKQLLNWCEVNNNKHIQEVAGNNVHRTSKQELLTSLKKLSDQKEVNITDLLSDKQVSQKDASGINTFKYYRQSPFYNVMRKVAEILEVMVTVVQYLKTDRRGRFDLSHLEHLYQLLKYFLLDRGIIKDDYIYSQGVSVSLVNLMLLLKDYFEKHPDNSGEQRQLLQFEKVCRKLWGLIKFCQISCTICIYKSLKLPNWQQQ